MIAVVGDSVASGEGNPPFTDGLIGPGRARAAIARETAYGAQVARKIEQADPHSSVTFVPVACSGAAISSYVGQRSIFNQIRYLKQLIGDRQIDALLVSAGANDLDFGFIVQKCVVWDACQTYADPKFGVKAIAKESKQKGLFAGVKGAPNGFTFKNLGDYLGDLVAALPSRYQQLQGELAKEFPGKQLLPSDVYLAGYPTPFYLAPGKLCQSLLGYGNAKAAYGFLSGFEGSEIPWAQHDFVEAMTAKQQLAARALGWRFVPIPTAQFAAHGYCAQAPWFVTVGSAARNANISGTLHPNAEGQQQMADDVFDYVNRELLYHGEARAPRT